LGQAVRLQGVPVAVDRLSLLRDTLLRRILTQAA
jgi:hypothetical protein